MKKEKLKKAPNLPGTWFLGLIYIFNKEGKKNIDTILKTVGFLLLLPHPAIH